MIKCLIFKVKAKNIKAVGLQSQAGIELCITTYRPAADLEKGP